MPAASDLNTLRRKRGNIIRQITSFTKFLDNQQEAEQRNHNLVQVHLKGLDEHWSRFDDIQSNIEELDESEEDRRFDIQNTYYSAVSRAHDLMKENPPTASTARGTNQSPALTISAPMSIQLPKMRLPTFDGTMEDWTSFHDIFSSNIDRNESLTPVQKLQYLRSALTEKAAAYIKELPTTDANYPVAMKMLSEKYNCKRKLLLRHCFAIRDVPKLKRDTPDALGDLTGVINQHLRALETLGEPISSWSTMLIAIILDKISPDTANCWQLTLEDKEMPSYTSLMAFLEKRADCSILDQPTTSRTHSRASSLNQRPTRQGPSRNHVFTTVNTHQCPICKGSHGIWHCDIFRSQSSHERWASIEKAALCPNCLGDMHPLKLCRSGTCRVCQKRHHTLLHKHERKQYEAAHATSSPGGFTTNGPSTDARPSTSA